MATDDTRIWEVAQNFCRVEMTRPEHPSGSDRIAEVCERCECDAIVNIQGDEPLIDSNVIDAVANALSQRAAGILPAEANITVPSFSADKMSVARWENEMSTAATLIKNLSELDNPNVVKVVVNAAGRALYFSRRTIPYLRDKVGRASSLSNLGGQDARPTLAASDSAAEQLAAFPFLKHLGIYGYRRETLLRLVKFPVSPLENAEKLEQLRALENGIGIAVVQVAYDSIGVDLPEDVAKVEAILSHG